MRGDNSFSLFLLFLALGCSTASWAFVSPQLLVQNRAQQLSAAVPRHQQQRCRPLQADVAADAASSDTIVPLVVEGRNIEITEALMDHVNKRIGGPLKKLGNGVVRECDVILSVSKNPKVKNAHRVEVVSNLKGTTIICNFESPDMYGSIDSAAHALYRKLHKYKERRRDGWHGGGAMGDELQAALDEMEEAPSAGAQEEDNDDMFVDPEAPVVTKVNSFDLSKPTSVQEAIFALDYVDHDFYVFKNEETNKITTVYKRHGGGIGLVEP